MSTSSRKDLRHVYAILADIGSVALVCVAIFSGIVAVMEFFRPGIVASAVAPQSLALLAVVALGFTLMNPERPKAAFASLSSAVGTVGYVIFSVAVSGFAVWGSWYYFESMGEARDWLTIAIGLTTVSLFAACASAQPHDPSETYARLSVLQDHSERNSLEEGI